MVKIRTRNIPGTMSIQLTKADWERIKAEGDSVFMNNNGVNYMQIAETNIFFDDKSPYFKEFQNKEE